LIAILVPPGIDEQDSQQSEQLPQGTERDAAKVPSNV